ncbi:MAG: hypothetical protein ACRECH_09180 [Nitrososphaerales archaeon]
MVTKIALVGLAILVVGIIVGFAGAYLPVSASSTQNGTLLSTAFGVDANDYQSKNLNLSQGTTIQVNVKITNTTIFQLELMNSNQYYSFYSCAPFCRQAQNNTAVAPTAPIGPQNLTAIQNVTVTPSTSQSFSFTAQNGGTYYFILDNTVGPSYATYLGQNASVVACNTPAPSACLTSGNLTITGPVTVNTGTINWLLVGPGIVLLIIGGIIATATWEKKRSVPRPRAQEPASQTPSTPTAH